MDPTFSEIKLLVEVLAVRAPDPKKEKLKRKDQRLLMVYSEGRYGLPSNTFRAESGLDAVIYNDSTRHDRSISYLATIGYLGHPDLREPVDTEHKFGGVSAAFFFFEFGKSRIITIKKDIAGKPLAKFLNPWCRNVKFDITVELYRKYYNHPVSSHLRGHHHKRMPTAA